MLFPVEFGHTKEWLVKVWLSMTIDRRVVTCPAARKKERGVVEVRE